MVDTSLCVSVNECLTTTGASIHPEQIYCASCEPLQVHRHVKFGVWCVECGAFFWCIQAASCGCWHEKEKYGTVECKLPQTTKPQTCHL